MCVFTSMVEDQGETADVTITRIPNIEKIQITSTLGEAIAGLKSYTEAKILVFFDNGPLKRRHINIWLYRYPD